MGERTNLIVEKDNNYRWFGRSIDNIGYKDFPRRSLSNSVVII